MKKNYIFNFVLLLVISNLFAQSVCQEQLVVSNEVTGFSLGQSIFMAECTGFFSSIELDRSDDGAEMDAELTIMTGQTFLGTPRYTQTVTIPAGGGVFSINLEGGTGTLAFFEDSQYTFLLSNPALRLQASSDVNSYVNGQMFVDVGFINNDDLWFKLNTTVALGIDELEFESRFVFPNPATGFIKVSGLYGPEPFSIYNSFGIKVKDGMVNENERIAVEDLSMGLYYLKVADGDSFKFIKN